MKTSRNAGRSKSGKGGTNLARIGVMAVIALMLAMAVMPLTPAGAGAANNDREIDTNLVLANPNVRDVNLTDPELIEIVDDVEVAGDPVLADPIAVGTVQVNKLGCEDDYEGDYDELAANCVPMNAEFTVLSGGGETSHNGSFVDEFVVVGDIQVVELLPAGYGEPIVFCDSYLADGSESGYWQATTSGGTIDYQLQPAEWLYCDWFNVPVETNTITINKWECPELLAFIEEPTVEEMLGACSVPVNDVTFELSYPDDDQAIGQTKSTGENGDGTVVFHDVLPGKVEIAEQIPNGYGDPVVACRWGAMLDNDGQLIAIDGLVPLGLLPGGVLEQEMLDGETLVCQWFNIPSNDGEVDVHKWECPEGWDAYNWSYDDLIVNCSEPFEGIDFTLTELGGDPEVLVGIQNSDANGDAIFFDVPAGSYALTEAMPTGYGAPIVYCYEVDGELQSYPVNESGRIEFELLSNETFVCDWFNIPANDGSITVYKFTCPAGYDIDAPWADPKTDCTEQTNGVNYVLSGFNSGDFYATTGDSFDGGWQRGSLDPDNYTISEELPQGTIATFVTCQWLDENGPYAWESVQLYDQYGAGVGNAIDVELYEATEIVCQWYNVPDYDDGGELVVIKYWCDGYIYDEQHCELYGGGADFVLGSKNGQGDPVFFSTGEDATAHLYLSPGEYGLAEVDRQWCKAESDEVNAGGYVEVYDGRTSHVTVYNCGPGKEKEPPVKKFPNTGAGDLTMTTRGDVGRMTVMMTVAGALLSLGLARTIARRAVTTAESNI